MWKYIVPIVIAIVLTFSMVSAELNWVSKNLGVGTDVNGTPFLVLTNNNRSQKVYIWINKTTNTSPFEHSSGLLYIGHQSSVEKGLNDNRIYSGDLELTTSHGTRFF